jgi:hypothetical protein
MKDLLDYNRFRMESMQSKICELESLVSTLETYCFELADAECTLDYKNLIKSELYKLKQQ